MRHGQCTLRAAILLFVACWPAPPALAWQQETDDMGVPLRWPTPVLRWRWSAPVAGWPDGGRSALARAAATWTAPPCTDLTVREAAAGEPAELVVDGQSRPWLRQPEDAAWTDRQVDHGTGRVTGAHLALNPAYAFAMSPPVLLPPGAATPVDLEAVLVHELGHALGLGHAQRRESVMYAGIQPDAAPKRHLTPDDVEGVCALFPVLRPGVAAPAHRPRRDQDQRDGAVASETPSTASAGEGVPHSGGGEGCRAWVSHHLGGNLAWPAAALASGAAVFVWHRRRRR